MTSARRFTTRSYPRRARLVREKSAGLARDNCSSSRGTTSRPCSPEQQRAFAICRGVPRTEL